MSTTPTAQILSIVDLIGYQEGAIVSRVILKAEAGNVTLFAFDAGQELSEHTTPFDASSTCWMARRRSGFPVSHFT